MISTNQFLLTKKKCPIEFKKKKLTFGLYGLYSDSQLNVNIGENEIIQIIIIGDIYDFENPKYSNKNILDDILKNNIEFKNVLFSTFKYSGEYLIFYYNKNSCEQKIFTDAAAQFEMYYSVLEKKEVVVSTSHKLIDYISPLIEDISDEANEFYNSQAFKNRKSFIVADTNYINLKRLKPNFSLNLENGEIKRYFPFEKRRKLTLEEAGLKASKMLKGYLEAAYRRYNLLIPVTAGWDSRVLLAASKDFSNDVVYHVFFRKNKHSKYEKDVPKKLLKKLNLPFQVIEEIGSLNQSIKKEIDKSILFPRSSAFENIDVFHRYYKNGLRLNGNISEVARLEFDEILFLTPKKITFIEKYAFSKYALIRYKKWFETNNKVFTEYNYRILDMLYWEENCANWIAKGKSEYRLMGINTFSPFNSRELLLILYGVDKKYRRKQNPVLYKEIIDHLWPEVLQVSVNPGLKKTAMRLTQKMGIFALFRNLKLWVYLFLGRNKW